MRYYGRHLPRHPISLVHDIIKEMWVKTTIESEVKKEFCEMSSRKINKRIDNIVSVLTNNKIKMGMIERIEMGAEASALARMWLDRH